MRDTVLKQFGKEVQALRLKKGLSQEALADAIGVHRTYMGFIERGERNLTLKNIFKLSRVLGVHLPDLFGFDVG
jgi:transcriptional regulator with XRE-family HTH domain